jgi:protein TonB
MKRLLFLFLMFSFSGYAQYTKKDSLTTDDTAEISPSFPGGDRAMSDFIKKNFVYPENAKESGISGKVWIAFTVEKDGSLSGIRLIRGLSGCPECDKEALRLVSIMPQWEPGTKNGQPVLSQINLPFTFRMQ